MITEGCCKERINQETDKILRVVEVASGRAPADLVLKNGEYVNVFTGEILKGDIAVAEGVIAGIGEYKGKEEIDVSGKIVLPGFIDAHIHLESAIVPPSEFARAVVPHGTTTVVTDPHEISNVMGTDGIRYMLAATEGIPVDVEFMLPSCVPATPMDESGAVLDYEAIDKLYREPRVLGLAEMMNFPGVVGGDRNTLIKLAAASVHGSRIDGHAPGITGYDLNAYVAAGVRSDHECADAEDAIAKVRRGQFIMIREGTAARKLEALLPLLKAGYSDRCMFCCDDKHPSDLLEIGHIDHLVRKSIQNGVDPIIAVRAASLNAASYFGLKDRGAIAPGCLADMVVVDNFEELNILQVFKKGKVSFAKGQVADFELPVIDGALLEHARNTFDVARLEPSDLLKDQPLGIIGMIPGEIITENSGFGDHIDISEDILKIAVIERHKGTGHIGVGYIKGYGLKSGAVATSISHDSHNLIVVGTNEEDMAFAVNKVVENRGGIVVADNRGVTGELVLPIAGIMSEDSLEEVNDALEKAKEAAFGQGVSRGIDPFMTLSFMALPVIPTLRVTTRGVIDVLSQKYI